MQTSQQVLLKDGAGGPRSAGPGEIVGDAALLPREFGMRYRSEMAVAETKVSTTVLKSF